MNLYFLAALLIREGYLSLEALFPHVSTPWLFQPDQC